MKKIFKTKPFFSLSKKIIITIILLIFFVFILLTEFSKKITPKLIHVAELKINKYVEHTASDFKIFILEKDLADDFLKVRENKNGEIYSIDYDMAKIYQVSEKLTTVLEESMNDSNILNEYINNKTSNSMKDGLLLFFPIGMASNSIFLSNLGPEIPLIIRFVGTVFSNVKTRVTDYGINNVLLDIYLEVSISYEILTPVVEDEKKIKYELLLDSKIIQGQIPEIYGGLMEHKSTFLEIST